MKRRYGIALSVAVVVVLAIVLIVALTPHRSFLDVLNAQIAKSSDFEPFYAGRGELPSTRDYLPELGDLEDAFEEIQAEALEVYEDHLVARAEGADSKIPRMDAAYNNIFKPVSDQGPLGKAGAFVSEKFSRLIYGDDVDTFTRIGSDNWRTFNLVLFNREVPGNAAKCPKLTRLVKRVPGMQSALISIVEAGGRIPPHSDPAKGVIRYHLAFKTPKDRDKCFIAIVDDEGTHHRYCWEEGKGVVFDEKYTHYVRNDTDEDRVILFMDILRPLKGPAKTLQGLANFANYHHPGVKRLIRESRVKRLIRESRV